MSIIAVGIAKVYSNRGENDMYEVRACILIGQGMVASFGDNENPPKNPQFFGVYERGGDGLLKHIADFDDRASAEEFKSELEKEGAKS